MAWYDFDEDLVYILRSAEVRGARDLPVDSITDPATGDPLNLRQGGVSVAQVVSDDFANATFQADQPTAMMTVGTRTWLAKSSEYEDQARTDAAAAQTAAAASATAASGSAASAASSLSTSASALATAVAALAASTGGAPPGDTLLTGDPQVGVTDPRRLYAGSVDGASIELSFPFLARDPFTGAVACLFKDGQDGIGTIGNVKLGISHDNGASFGASSTVYAGSGGTMGGPAGITVLANGNWLATFMTFTSAGTSSYRVNTSVSTDKGATWSAPTVLSGYPFTSWVACASPVVQLSNGDLVLPLYGANTTGNQFVDILASVNGGTTWTSRATIAVSGQDVQEPTLAEVTPGHLVLLMRGGDHNTRRATSSDFGATWAAAATAWSGFNSKVSIAKFTSGRYLCYDRDTNGAAWVRWSDDNLATFSSPQFLVWPDIRVTYGDILETTPGRMLCVYGAELWGSTGSASPQGDIWSRFLTDGVGGTPTGQGTDVASRVRAASNVRDLLAWDTFRRPDNAFGVGAMDSGHHWNALTTGGSAFGALLSGQTVHVPASQSTDLWTELNLADVDIEADIVWSAGTNTSFGITFRYAADTSHLLAILETSGTIAHLYKVSAAQALTSLATGTTLALAPIVGKYNKLRVRCNGNNIKFYVDDDLVAWVADATNNTATKHGIHLSNNSSSDQHCRRFVARAA